MSRLSVPAVASLGYTPVNKAGDTMTGALAVQQVVRPTMAAFPGSPTDGDLAYDQAQKAHRFRNPVGTLGAVGLALSAHGTTDTIANTTTLTNFTNTHTFPANSLVAGKTIRLTASGRYGTDTAAPTLLPRLRVGATSATNLSVAAAITLTATVAAEVWWLDAMIKIISATDAEANGIMRLLTSTGATTSIGIKDVGTAIDTTIANVLAIGMTWGTAHASNTITLRQLLVEVLN